MTKSSADAREWFTPVWVVPVLLALLVAAYSTWGPTADPHVIPVPPAASP
jgi:hypothetical protein